MTVLLILLWIVSFMVLVITHELWHFFAAKKSGVKVNEFWIGLPPRICKIRTDKSWTEYTINAIPLGWFCVLEWDDPNRPEATYAKNSFVTAKLWKKLIIMIGGITVNALTAFLIFTGLFWYGTAPLGISSSETSESYLIPSRTFLESQNLLEIKKNDGVKVLWLNSEDSLFETGDVLLAFNNEVLTIDTINEILETWMGKENRMKIKRGEEEKEIWLFCENDCKLWIYISSNDDITLLPIKFWLGEAMLASVHEIWAERTLTFDALWKLGKSLFSFNKEELKESFASLSWPVGAIKMGELFFKSWGWTAYLAFVWIIALALAIFNLLPIPALDGGSGICLILQAIFKISHEKYLKYIGYINAFFFWSLMILWIVIILKDLVTYWGLPLPFIA